MMLPGGRSPRGCSGSAAGARLVSVVVCQIRTVTPSMSSVVIALRRSRTIRGNTHRPARSASHVADVDRPVR